MPHAITWFEIPVADMEVKLVGLRFLG